MHYFQTEWLFFLRVMQENNMRSFLSAWTRAVVWFRPILHKPQNWHGL